VCKDVCIFVCENIIMLDKLMSDMFEALSF